MLSENIRYYRTEAGCTMEQVAEFMCVDRSMIAHYESGFRRPSLDRLLQLAEFFNVSTDDLLEGEQQ